MKRLLRKVITDAESTVKTKAALQVESSSSSSELIVGENTNPSVVLSIGGYRHDRCE